jgi:hypothetical protein
MKSTRAGCVQRRGVRFGYAWLLHGKVDCREEAKKRRSEEAKKRRSEEAKKRRSEEGAGITIKGHKQSR